jgi:sugar lactone lactonase YvrE
MSFSKQFTSGSVFLVTLLLSFLLTACGGGGATGGAGVTGAGQLTFAVGGTVSGLSGTVVLQDNNGDNLTVIANGTFTFSTKVADGKPYNVTVLTQPTGLSCSVSTGAGTISSSNVSNVAVVCSKDAYNIGGSISGLTGSVVLQDNNGDNLTVTSNGSFTFATKVAYGSPYSVSVTMQPTGQICSVSTGAGTVSTSNVSNVTVTCSSNAFNVGGTVTGLSGAVVLQNNTGDNLVVSTSSNFTFATKVAYGSQYSVTVLAHPAGQSCSVASGTGIIGNANITNVSITCANAYTLGGTVFQLNGSMVLQNNATGNHAVSVNGAFTFPSTVPSGGTYNVTVLTHPTNQRCLVANGTGSATTNVTNVNLTCASQMGGAMQGVALNLLPSVSTFASGFKPVGITSDGANLYVADYANNKILQIVIATGAVTTLAGTGAVGAADGPGTAATFNQPVGITSDGSNLYVVEYGNNKIRKIVIATGVVSSFTGVANTAGAVGAADDAGAVATFNLPMGITTDGSNLYVVDYGNNKIRKIVIATGVVSSFTGAANTAGVVGAADGAGASATFKWPRSITSDGTNVYVADMLNSKIRKIVIATGVVSSMTGVANTAGVQGSTDGAASTATFNWPIGITSDGTNLYVTDTDNQKIRKIVITTGDVSSLTGVANTAGVAGTTDGGGAAATFNKPQDITSDGTNLYVADTGNNTIRKIQ